MRRTLLLVSLCALPLALSAQEKVDLAVINRIRAEAFQNSKVMDYMFQLTEGAGSTASLTMP